MQKLTFNLDKYKHPQKAPYYHWQQEALECLKYLDQPNKSQVFQWYKCKECQAVAALRYMQERHIKSFRYMAKLMSG